LSERDILDLCERVSYAPVSLRTATSPFAATLTVEQRDGTSTTVTVDYPEGSPERPAEPASIRRKFHANAALAVTADRAELLEQALGSIDELDDVSAICTALPERALTGQPAPALEEAVGHGLRRPG
jgi:2-methylcitrate dehydratase PrpD